jgi:cytochrome c peroxidase
MKNINLSVLFLFAVALLACSKDEQTNKLLDICVQGFPELVLTSLPTEKGAELGRLLFYDPLFSKDGSISCGSCHVQKFGFTDGGNATSEGVGGARGNRNASSIINAAWGKHFFWDGRAATLQEQSGEPVENPIEMDQSWDVVLAAIKINSNYVSLFSEVFPEEKNIERFMVEEVLTQFEKTLVSSNSKFDKFVEGGGSLSDQEMKGMDLFFDEGGECFHCHGMPTFTDNEFHNNGLDSAFTDLGRYDVSGVSSDKGLFLTPTLRNIEVTGPYMHDGRFATLEEVVEFYSTGVHYSTTIDPLIVGRNSGGTNFSVAEKEALVAFLKTLTDEEFLGNPEHSNPYK